MIKLGNNVHPHLKNDVADQTTLSSTEIETKVSTEVTRASNAETALSGRIVAESERASEAEANLLDKIASEKSRAEAAEKTLTDNLAAEIAERKSAIQEEAAARASEILSEKTRAEAAEKTLTDNLAAEVKAREDAISKEVSDRNAAILSAVQGLDVASVGADGSYIETIEEKDGKLTATKQAFDKTISSTSDDKCAPTTKAVYTSVNAEKSRAEEAEKNLTDNLAAEVARASETEKTLTESLSSEVTRAKAAEKTLTDSLAAEVKRAEAAETTLTDNLAAEVTRATEAEAALSASLSTETTRATGAEKTLTDNLSAEVTRAKAAEKTLTDNLTSEVTRAKAAEKTLTDNLAAEVTRAKAAEKTLTDNLAAEVTNRATAITNAINALDVSDTAVAGKYISQVSETNGKITVTRASFSSAVTSGDTNAPSGDAVYKAIQGLGTLYHIKDSVASKTALDALDTKTLEPGEVRNTNDTGDNYVWTGSAWDRLGGSTVISALDFSSPAASGTTTSFIDTVSQTDGKISATKKTITSASTSAKGIVQLSSATDSTSETLAATPKAVKAVQDAVTAEVTNRNTAISNAIAALDGTITGTAGAANTVTALSETDGKVSATFGAIQIAQSQVTGLSDALAEKQASGSYKTTQTAVSDPTASGTSATFIDTISQNANGVITATKKTVRTMGAATASAAGSTGLVPAPAAGKQGQYLRGDGTWATPTNTTYSAATTSAAGLMSAADKTKLDGIATGANNYTYTHPTTSGNKHIPSGGSSGQILRWSADGTAVWGSDNNTTYSAATQSAAGLMSAADKTKLDGIATGANKYTYTLPTASSSALGGVKSATTGTTANRDYNVQVNSDGTMKVNVPWTDNNTTYGTVSTTAAGLAPKVTDTTKYLRGDGTWQTPKDTTYSAATTAADGLMSASDKTKLNSLNLKGSFDSSTGILTLTSV